MAFKIATSGANLRWEMIEGSVDVIINVSEDYDLIAHKKAQDFGIFYHWFPMNEHGTEMGFNSLIGALNIIELARRKEWSVVVHCIQGQNRSVTVKEVYEWMREDFPYMMATPALDKNADGVRLPKKDRLKDILSKFKQHLVHPGGFHSWLDFIKSS